MNVRFTDEMNPSRAARVTDVLRAPRLWIPTAKDYGPGHKDWLAKVEHELAVGARYALHAQVDGRSAGAVIWRSNETDPTLMDIRNISIDPAMNGRYFGAFMLRNAEFLMREQHPSVRTVQADTKTTNPDMRAFLARQGYTEVGVVDLYGSGKLDVLLHKTIGE